MFGYLGEQTGGMSDCSAAQPQPRVKNALWEGGACTKFNGLLPLVGLALASSAINSALLFLALFGCVFAVFALSLFRGLYDAILAVFPVWFAS